ncbi:UPF0668 protein C10orf76 -like protein [Trichinella pseudospiralis]|uniref:UPF0668 protein C10orf76-like protein n=1 Tax=Trichinella pseudospiralis TaxID=6337 RepID=A0A0V1EY85_TRIPS|nr:UPF0668 protein C10orf76 -like protein [Trichinella pseudospiralis]KRY93016.1 UPF0668 protein C10orf76 -like protein [Trichinella pseudospiralis]KRZ46179.1 UPF0668 protein C10orf76 -like protein [Trichinella pseudospiralis]
MGKSGNERRKSVNELVCKVVSMYDKIFKSEVDDSNDEFWEELFLLWANKSQLCLIVDQISIDQMQQIKQVINCFVSKCITTITHQEGIRVYNAIQTFGFLICAVAKKKEVLHCSFNLIDILFGIDNGKTYMQILIARLCSFLTGNYSPVLKSCTLEFFLTMATVTENINENPLMEYFMNNCIFEALTFILEKCVDGNIHGRAAVVLLALLINYQKSVRENPYMVKLSILDNDLALNGYSFVLSRELHRLNRSFENALPNSTPSLWTFFGSVFSSDVQQLPSIQIDHSVLLALYEAVHLNRNFITALTTVPAQCEEVEMHSTDVAFSLDDKAMECSSNLFATFLSYCSCVISTLKEEKHKNATRLCFIILTCITEDQYANMLMQDLSLSFKLPLFSRPMLHRKAEWTNHMQARPLACSVLSLCVEFIVSHLMKAFPFDLYSQVLGIIHRILCFNKRCKVRLEFQWSTLWNVLFTLLRYVVNNCQMLIAEGDVFELCSQVLVILNVFITFGDTFLPQTEIYDELYYELLRNNSTLQAMCILPQEYAEKDSPYSESAKKLLNGCVNVKAILSHFLPKLDAAGCSVLSKEQILAIVRQSYVTLSLKLQENLDNFSRYQEKSAEVEFFTNIVRSVVIETLESLNSSTWEQAIVIKELQTIR